MVNKISNQTVHHQSATKFASMWQDIKKKLPACKTARLVTAFLILRKKKQQQQNYPKYINDVVSKILEKKKQLADVLSQFVIFLKL